MTLMDDRLDMSLPERFNNALILRQEEPAPAVTMEDWQSAMDEMERSYRIFQAEYTNQFVTAPEPPATPEDIYAVVRDVERQLRQLQALDHPYGDYPGSYCYCSPTRGMFFERYGEGERLARQYLEWPEPLTYTRWEPPVPEPEPVSTELVVISKPVLDPVETIPAPEPKRLSFPKMILAGISALLF